MAIEQFRANQPKSARSTGPRAKRRRSALFRLNSIIQTWRSRARSRYALSHLSDHTLKDLGLPRTDVYCKSVEPFRHE
jgi:uncharacterized protein YjiS (DUF1127 family)